MALTKKEFSDYIKQFKFRELFNDMGWNNDRTTQPIAVDTLTFQLNAVAEKSGFKILLCSPLEDGSVPDYSTRKKIETKVTKLFQEHLIIFTDIKKKEQVWQLVVRRSGKPTKVTETRYHISQDPELLYQRAAGIFFELDEEEHITIIDVTKRIADNFSQNNEKVTKLFYDGFTKEHKSFLAFIKGIDNKVNKEWYASLMLNRLMFCYFIQKKGFLDENKDYLRDKLKACQQRKGKDKFYSFYRNFLVTLFHHGLGAPDHSKELKAEIGRIPYLNGGLFDVHELERAYDTINIDDKAFEKIFDFFDEWEWHLDTRLTASGKDINPDVIGYIFEKYINDRADMGAYYTKEDITDYISKNCVIPYLFDETKRQYAKAFSDKSELWQWLKESGDTYIYEAVKKGVKEVLPEEVAAGVNEVSKRAEWNKTASDKYALPTEIWREVIDRRNRYEGLKAKIGKGEINNINDFISCNLHINQFAIDSISNTSDPEFLKCFYKILNSITIIDPTCGSGAFLFAAMNILEELYEGCIIRMQNFISEAPRGKYKFFEETIKQVTAPEHPNLKYFIYKSIILRNLYGVDIMKEAVEIAKLRLFLRLIATVEADYRKPNLGLEPLPDIDFNIRAGNTLVGFATERQLETGSLDYQSDKEKVQEEMKVVGDAFKRFKEFQLMGSQNYVEFKNAKSLLDTRLQKLTEKLDKAYYNAFGNHTIKFEKWKSTHIPFHWFAEFYEIIYERGGFDVVIGNPPYVVYNETSFAYRVNGYLTSECKDLYAYVIERSMRIINPLGVCGMIVPISIVSTDGFNSLRVLLENETKSIWYSNFSMRPGKLFEGAEKHLTIFIASKSATRNIYSTKYFRWYGEERETLFSLINYAGINKEAFHNNSIPKIGTYLEADILSKIKSNKSISNYTVSSSSNIVFHTRKLRYFVQFLDVAPQIFEEDGSIRVTSELKEIYFKTKEDKLIAFASYLSSLFFWYYISYSDCRNLNRREVMTFPISIDNIEGNQKNSLVLKAKELLKSLQANSYFQEAFYKKYGKLKMQVFQPRLSKPIIDEIDAVLAVHYGFTEEELDFIINYDIKYRMGKELEEEDEE